MEENYSNRADTLVVLDFETTGLSPDQGDRAIEIGAVRIENGIITERFQELMNPGMRVSAFIESYTGITNTMLKSAPPCSEVMPRFAEFIAGYNLVAHNASFDKRFLDAELKRIPGVNYRGKFACSLLASRRIFQSAPSHKLGNLVRYANIPVEGEFHRALYDSEMTAKLWMAMLTRITQDTDTSQIHFAMMQKLAKVPKAKVSSFLADALNHQ